MFIFKLPNIFFNNLLKRFLPILCLVLFSLTAQATEKNKFNLDLPSSYFLISAIEDEGDSEDDLVIIEEEISETVKKSEAFDMRNYYDEHFSSLASASYAGFIGNARRTFYYLQTRYREESKELGLSGVFEIRAYRSSNEIKFESETIRTDGVRITRDINLDISDSKLQVREAYLRLSRPKFDLYAGRRIVTFGQFDAFSPVDFLLPVDYSNSVLTFSKVDNKFPQTVFSATLYPIENWELEFHYFPKIERDFTVVKTFEKSSSGFTSNGDPKAIPFNKPSDESQKAVRLLYTGQKLTLGFTYYKGFQITPSSLNILKNDHFEPTGRTYRDLTGYGVEASYAYKSVNFKYEVVSFNYFSDLASCSTSPGIRSSCEEYRTYVKNNLRGRAYIEPRLEIHALGFDYNSDDWTLNAAILAIFNRLSSADKEAENISDQAIDFSSNMFSKIFLPTFNIAKKYGTDKKHTTGFGFAFMSSAVGASLYHIYNHSEDLFFTGAVEFLRYRNDEATEEQLEEENQNARVTLKSDSLLLRVGAAYLF